MIGMGRRPRVHYQGAVYHVMARGVDGRDIYYDDFDRTVFLDGMRRIERETSAEVIAYCLMGNHFHLAVRVGAVALASVMQRLLTGYSMTFNRRHDRTGHLFQARYKAILCLDDRYLAGLIHYIHMNPVRAGFVSAPQDWPWSSFKAGQKSTDDFLEFDPWPSPVSLDVDLTRCPSTEPVGLEAVGSLVASGVGIGIDELRTGTRRRSVVAARRVFVRDAVRTGHPLIAIAKWLNVSPPLD